MSNIITAGNATNNGTSISSDTSGVLELKTGSTPTTALTINASQNVGIGTASPTGKLTAIGSAAASAVNFDFGNSAAQAVSDAVTLRFLTSTAFVSAPTAAPYISAIQTNASTSNTDIAFGTFNGTSLGERMRIDNSGKVLVNITSDVIGNNPAFIVNGTGFSNGSEFRWTGTGSFYNVMVANGNGFLGGINTSGSTTSYVNLSDYRVKENINPMVNALDKIALLKPCTFTYKTDGIDGQGFIAHELQEVFPDAVVGEKDAVDAEGKPIYQGVDTSFLVATLTAAIQELKAELDATKAEVAALKGA